MRFNHFSRDQKTRAAFKDLDAILHSKPVLLFEYSVVAIVITGIISSSISTITFLPLLFIGTSFLLFFIHSLVYGNWIRILRSKEKP
ncbi:hypothetical protein ACOI1C_10460 [Bacillus sp. DJP31]|uniref:hypothetical protein n=1 Tax=Bacillus sp. DJP31 TaxID=3409789 RepID=UPI003BB6D328